MSIPGAPSATHYQARAVVPRRITDKEHAQIDQRTLKLLVGLIAILLANVCSYYSKNIDSISAAYFEGGWARDIFVGSLFAITAFLIAYNGMGTWEKCLSKIGAIAAFGVAMFPCECLDISHMDPAATSVYLCEHADAIRRMSGIHYYAAAVLFLVLAEFCRLFYVRAKRKGHAEARIRMGIYTVCGIAMLAALVFLAAGGLWNITFGVPRSVFEGERAGLIAFGLSWLTASKVLPGISSRSERLKLM